MYIVIYSLLFIDLVNDITTVISTLLLLQMIHYNVRLSNQFSFSIKSHHPRAFICLLAVTTNNRELFTWKRKMKYAHHTQITLTYD